MRTESIAFLIFCLNLCETFVAAENLLDTGQPYLEWCEGAHERRRVTVSECAGVSFVYPYPKCYCLNGIALVRVAYDTHAVSEIQFGTGGCFSHKTHGAHNRTIELTNLTFYANDTIVGLQRAVDHYDFYTLPLTVQTKPLRTVNNIVVYNGEVIDTGEDYNGSVLYCVQRHPHPEVANVVRQFSVPPNTFVWLNETCDGGDYIELEIVRSGRLADREHSSCSPECPEFKANQTTTALGPSMKLLAKKKPKDYCMPVPYHLQDIHGDLNERILKQAINRAFHGQQQTPPAGDLKPKYSFQIMELLVRLTARFCRNAHVPQNFLEQGLDYFKVAHEGRGFYFGEDLSHREFMTISRLLRRCMFNVNETLQFSSSGCADRWEVLKVYKTFSVAEKRPVYPSAGHEYFDHHLVLDIPWNMVDLVNVACIDAFAPSYRMYHKMEQAMEKLFTHELRFFWLFPQIPSFYYDHLFGPNWQTHARNHEKCVDAAYMMSSAPRMSRLLRPQWIPGHTGNSRGRGTAVDPICSRRRSDVAVISDSYEIYCQPLSSLTGDGGSNGQALRQGSTSFDNSVTDYKDGTQPETIIIDYPEAAPAAPSGNEGPLSTSSRFPKTNVITIDYPDSSHEGLSGNDVEKDLSRDVFLDFPNFKLARSPGSDGVILNEPRVRRSYTSEVKNSAKSQQTLRSQLSDISAPTNPTDTTYGPRFFIKISKHESTSQKLPSLPPQEQIRPSRHLVPTSKNAIHGLPRWALQAVRRPEHVQAGKHETNKTHQNPARIAHNGASHSKKRALGMHTNSLNMLGRASNLVTRTTPDNNVLLDYGNDEDPLLSGNQQSQKEDKDPLLSGDEKSPKPEDPLLSGNENGGLKSGSSSKISSQSGTNHITLDYPAEASSGDSMDSDMMSDISPDQRPQSAAPSPKTMDMNVFLNWPGAKKSLGASQGSEQSETPPNQEGAGSPKSQPQSTATANAVLDYPSEPADDSSPPNGSTQGSDQQEIPPNQVGADSPKSQLQSTASSSAVLDYPSEATSDSSPPTGSDQAEAAGESMSGAKVVLDYPTDSVKASSNSDTSPAYVIKLDWPPKHASKQVENQAGSNSPEASQTGNAAGETSRGSSSVLDYPSEEDEDSGVKQPNEHASPLNITNENPPAIQKQTDPEGTPETEPSRKTVLDYPTSEGADSAGSQANDQTKSGNSQTMAAQDTVLDYPSEEDPSTDVDKPAHGTGSMTDVFLTWPVKNQPAHQTHKNDGGDSTQEVASKSGNTVLDYPSNNDSDQLANESHQGPTAGNGSVPRVSNASADSPASSVVLDYTNGEAMEPTAPTSANSDSSGSVTLDYPSDAAPGSEPVSTNDGQEKKSEQSATGPKESVLLTWPSEKLKRQAGQPLQHDQSTNFTDSHNSSVRVSRAASLANHFALVKSQQSTAYSARLRPLGSRKKKLLTPSEQIKESDQPRTQQQRNNHGRSIVHKHELTFWPKFPPHMLKSPPPTIAEIREQAVAENGGRLRRKITEFADPGDAMIKDMKSSFLYDDDVDDIYVTDGGNSQKANTTKASQGSGNFPNPGGLLANLADMQAKFDKLFKDEGALEKLLAKVGNITNTMPARLDPELSKGRIEANEEEETGSSSSSEEEENDEPSPRLDLPLRTEIRAGLRSGQATPNTPIKLDLQVSHGETHSTHTSNEPVKIDLPVNDGATKHGSTKKNCKSNQKAHAQNAWPIKLDVQISDPPGSTHSSGKPIKLDLPVTPTKNKASSNACKTKQHPPSEHPQTAQPVKLDLQLQHRENGQEETPVKIDLQLAKPSSSQEAVAPIKLDLEVAQNNKQIPGPSGIKRRKNCTKRLQSPSQNSVGKPVPIKLDLQVPTQSGAEQSQIPNPIRIDLQVESASSAPSADIIIDLQTPAPPLSQDGATVPVKLDLQTESRLHDQASGDSQAIKLDLPVDGAKNEVTTLPIKIDLPLEGVGTSSSSPIKLDLPFHSGNSNAGDGTAIPVKLDLSLSPNAPSGGQKPKVYESGFNIYIDFPKRGKGSQSGRATIARTSASGSSQFSSSHSIKFPTSSTIVEMYVPSENEGLNCAASSQGQYQPFKNNCKLFYTCTKRQSSGVEGMQMLFVLQCIPGHYFDPASQQCVEGQCK